MHLLLTQKIKWCILLVLLAVVSNSQAQTISSFKKVLDGSKNQVAKDSFITMKDEAYFDPATLSKLDTPYQVKNIITFRINEAAVFKLPVVFTATAVLRIIYTRPDKVVDSIDKSLVITYSDTSTYTSTSSFVFNNAHQVDVKILSVTTSASTDILPVLLVENEMDVHPVYKLSCTNDVIKSIYFDSPADTADQIHVSWQMITGADVYDLEWTYVDSSAVAENKYGNPVNASLLFRNNASRVTLADYSYNIPLIYHNKGVLYFRVRAVQEKKNNVRIETAWSSAYTSGLGQYSFNGHERSLNWQSSVSFAEDGKRKVVVQYYDGSLRGRQTVTKDNSTNTLLVGESLYDYQGRPVIQVMPAPTLGSAIKYSRNFNTALNGAEYDKSNYDTLLSPADFLSASANGMSTGSGASQYYSPANPDKNNGINKYIPDAGGFAFTETSYTQDNTSRISRQGGAGPVYRLGSNHETRYSYAAPGEKDLDVLFGTEAGSSLHYFKNTVQDANGQYAVAYMDMHGRTIATALAGTPDSADLESLSSNVPFEVTDTLSGASRNIIRDLVMESSHSQVVVVREDYHFRYAVSPPVLQMKDYDGNTVCYKGLYDLEIKITDDAFNQRLPDGKAFDTILHNYIPGPVFVDCSPTDSLVFDFTINLKKGTYEISKRLTVNREALDFYRDSIFMKKNMRINLEEFVQQQRTLQTNTQCIPDCKSCRDSVGTWDEFRANYIHRSGIENADTSAYRREAASAYLAAIEACDVLCNKVSEISSIRNAMLVDMTASSGGQYANAEDTLDIYSVFYHEDEDVPAPYSRNTVTYLDAAGHIDSVYDETTNAFVRPQDLTPAQFAAKFKASWAEALLPFHPEYCKLIAYQSYQSAMNWADKFKAVDGYIAARDSGYLNPTANSSKYGFNVVAAHKDSLAMTTGILAGKQNQLEAVLSNYNGGDGSANKPVLSMWRTATITLKCPDASPASTCFTTYNTDASAFNSNMCPGDLDMAWRNFREMYLMARTNLINADIKAIACSNIKTSDLLAAGKQLNFNNVEDALKQNNLDYLGKSDITSAAATDSANKALAASYDANCRSYVSAWLSQLSRCQFYDTAQLRIAVVPLLINVCKEGSDMDHPYGASSVKPASTYGYRSFQAVMQEYNQQRGISDSVMNCSTYLITAPKAYDKQLSYSDKKSYQKPTDCECGNLLTLQAEYNKNKRPSDVSFAAYLNRTRGVSLTSAQLDLLLASCNSAATCTFLDKPVVIPALIRCNVAPACATCTDIDTLYNQYTIKYPTITPSKEETDTLQQHKNEFFAAYMNYNLGFSKQAWEYLTFIDSCQQRISQNNNDCLAGKALMHGYTNSSADVISDLIRTADKGFIMVGSTTVSINNTDAYVIKTDENGDILWSRHYGGAANDNFNRVRQTADGGYIAIGTIRGYATASDAFIVKMNDTGGVVWSRRIGYNTTYGEVGTDIIQTSEGDYAFASKYNIGDGIADAMIGAIDANGTAKWIKRIGTDSGEEGYSLLQNNDTLVIVGCSFISRNFDGWVLKLNRTSGAVINITQYDIGDVASTNNYSSYIYKTNTGYIMNFANGNDAGAKQSLISINNAGNVIYSKQLSKPINNTVTQWMPFTIAANGGIMAVQNLQMSPNNRITWQRINADTTLAWSEMIKLDTSANINRVVENGTAGFVGAGNYGNGAFLMFTPTSGKLGCNDTTVSGTYTYVPTRVTRNVTWWQINFIQSNSSVVVMNITAITCDPVHRIFNCIGTDTCAGTIIRPLLCGNAAPLFPTVTADSINNCTDNEFFAVSKGTELFMAYRDSVKGSFNDAYTNTALRAVKNEVFTVHYSTSEYHYTLFYYDQAGNLVRTVPPAGVVIDRSESWISRVRAARLAGDTLRPPHRMYTQYRYNTLNQVVSQQSPDAGITRFWYDRLGRLAFSQNALQASNNAYIYNKYDDLGRVLETGEITSATPMTQDISRNANNLAVWMSAAGASRTQITHTNYDIAYSPLSSLELSAKNLRNRVSWSAIYNTSSNQDSGKYAAATFYSYDMHGQVDTLLQDYKLGGMALAGHRFKKMVYRYDLISGNVNQVAYQPGKADAFYHRYSYDAENRIVNVETSHDSIFWENDAHYQYYKHGPLAKAIIGQQQVQGLDYAYTLQGWLKGVNSSAVTPAFDMGHDGATGSIVAKDAFGFSLHYFGSRDYRSIDTTVNTFADVPGISPLFNGNIAAMSQNMPSLGAPLVYSYKYDVLNRLKKMDASNGLNTVNNTWTPVALPDFKERISYDANGNILTYNRKGNNTFANKPLAMDSMSYNYLAGTNKLTFIKDAIDTGNYDDDIDNQPAGNYTYDAIGNMVSDSAAGIRNISWTIYGKIASITKKDGTHISYSYDVSGNRVSKTVNGVQTWYVRDAGGQVFSTYSLGDQAVNNGAITQTETHLYGSARLGINTLRTNVDTSIVPETVNLTGLGSGFNVNFIRGKKFFELSNHLGNVLTTVSDKKISIFKGSVFDHYETDVVSAEDYYPFGMQMPGREFSGSKYRYGFNGQEKSNEIDPNGNHNTAEYWEYDTRIGRRWNLDPLPQINKSDYSVFSNNPINTTDPDGAYSRLGAAWRAMAWGGSTTYSESRKSYGVTYADKVWDKNEYNVVTAFKGEKQSFGKEIKENYLNNLENQDFWKGELGKGHVAITDSRVIAAGSWASLALPGGKLLGPVAEGMVYAEGGSGLVFNETKTILTEVAISVKNAGPILGRFGIPKYYTYLAKGKQIFVTPHAMKHLEELLANGIKLGDDYLKLLGQTHQKALHAAIEDVISRGPIEYRKMYFSGGNEIMFSGPRAAGELESVIHFR